MAYKKHTMKNYKRQIAIIYLTELKYNEDVRPEFTQWANNNEIRLREIEKLQNEIGLYTFMGRRNNTKQND